MKRYKMKRSSGRRHFKNRMAPHPLNSSNYVSRGGIRL